MIWLRQIQRRLRALFRKQKLDTQMDDEMRSHIEMQTQENVEAGMTPEEARHIQANKWTNIMNHKINTFIAALGILAAGSTNSVVALAAEKEQPKSEAMPT